MYSKEFVLALAKATLAKQNNMIDKPLIYPTPFITNQNLKQTFAQQLALAVAPLEARSHDIAHNRTNNGILAVFIRLNFHFNTPFHLILAADDGILQTPHPFLMFINLAANGETAIFALLSTMNLKVPEIIAFKLALKN